MTAACAAGDSLPMIVHGSRVSYFTGKLEVALRLKGLPYRLQPMNSRAQRHDIPRTTGVFQMPALELADGRWLTDSTPIIGWLDRQFPASPLTPAEPLQRFFCRLLEDYADEWLWRPAMHYRWHYREGAELLSRQLADELLHDLPLPGMVKRALIRQRQRHLFTRGDGVDARTIDHVEGIYRRTLATLEAIFVRRPFLLGEHPSLADIGFFGPMFRHFSIDPVPATIMRAQAPATCQWVARLWAARTSTSGGPWLSGIPADWSPLLDDIGSAYLPYLRQNASAIAAGQSRFSIRIQGADYRGVRSSRYRVWCLERLQAGYHELPPAAKALADPLLQQHDCLDALCAPVPVRSGHDPDNTAPFCRGLGMFGR